MKIKAQVELDISSEERKRIAIEYLESLLPYEHSLIKKGGQYIWFENIRDHSNTIFHWNEKRKATPFEVSIHNFLIELKNGLTSS